VSADLSFEALVHRLRRGDNAAWAELVSRHEAEVRRVIRSRLGAEFRPLLDTVDVWQSVLASFFVRVRLGQFELGGSRDLVKLLARMARNKVVSQGRKLEADRRDCRRVEPASGDEAARAADPGPSPSEAASHGELLRRVRDQLTAEERQLADLKAQGYGWQEISHAVGGAPNALRMRLVRAIDRAARRTGLDEVGDA
jgi:RNA polymerase sigma factor (sigma-70 family)